MDELEQKLREARLAEPSADLDRRIAAAFGAARPPVASPRRLGLAWWLAAAAAGGVAALVWLTPEPAAPARRETIYRFEAQGRMRDMLLNAPGNGDITPAFVIQAGRP